jgi:hypothetical protein
MQKIHCTKWISIVADDVFAGQPFATIFLSYGYFKRAPVSNKFFFDGAITSLSLTESPIPRNKIFIYAGSITKWTGIVEFTKLFNRLAHKLDAELHIYGNGNSEIINSITLENNKIKFLGFVTPKILDLACKQAYAFVNPRPIQVFHGENNFPSKLLLYLAYQKPIISTHTEGLSPDYDQLLLFYEDNNIDSLSNTIKDIYDNAIYSLFQKRVRNFAKNNTWEKKTKQLLINLNIS